MKLNKQMVATILALLSGAIGLIGPMIAEGMSQQAEDEERTREIREEVQKALAELGNRS